MSRPRTIDHQRDAQWPIEAAQDLAGEALWDELCERDPFLRRTAEDMKVEREAREAHRAALVPLPRERQAKVDVDLRERPPEVPSFGLRP